MKTCLIPELLSYFFGDHLSSETVDLALSGHPEYKEFEKDIREKSEKRELHKGVYLTSYTDIDTGKFFCVLQEMPNYPSMITFFAHSQHRVFGGSTLMCIPLQFCTRYFELDGEYMVYRHTFKTPNYDEKELRNLVKTGEDDQAVKAFLYPFLREAYDTIPGMSYVGMTKRSWQARYKEHGEKAMEKISSTKFHEAIRDMQGKKVICVHDVSAFGLTYDDAKEYERNLIADSSLYPKGLNMKVG